VKINEVYNYFILQQKKKKYINYNILINVIFKNVTLIQIFLIDIYLKNNFLFID
jgi:hypothetical protein